MNKNFPKFVKILISLIFNTINPAFTQDYDTKVNANRHSFVLEVHNDLFVRKDRHFTSGVVIGAKFNQVPKILRTFLPDYEVDQFIATLSQDIYTPTDLTRSDLVKDDYPYAGHLYLSFSVVQNEDNISEYTRFRIGIIGPAAGGKLTQKLIHKVVMNIEPQGWENQLKNEFGINLTRLRAYNYDLYNDDILAIRSITYAGGSVGTFSTKATVGQKLLIGYNLPKDMFGTFEENGKNVSVYASAGAEAEYVARDIFLDGNTFKDSHSIEKVPFRGVFTAGLTFRYKKLFLTYQHSLQSKVFKGQEGFDNWGAIYFNFSTDW